MFRILLVLILFIVGCTLLFNVEFFLQHFRESADGCRSDEKSEDYREYKCCDLDVACKGTATTKGTGIGNRSCWDDKTRCVANGSYRPIIDPDLKDSIAAAKSSCKNAVNAAKAMGDDKDDPEAFPARSNNAYATQLKIDGLITELSAYELQSQAIASIAGTKTHCDAQNEKYRDWQSQLDQLQQAPCKTEAAIQLPGAKNISDSAASNASGLNDILASLEARLAIIEKNLEDNEVTIANSKYNELLIDSNDPRTFDFSLPNATPVVSIVGTKPQKLRFVLPKGQFGPPGNKGDPGPNYAGPMSTGLRGPKGEISHYSGLPEQWTPYI